MTCIYLDKRTGSGELYPFFPTGLAKLTTLEFGDASFTGNGPEGAEVKIGIERKTMRDLLNCMVDGRLSGHQLPGLTASYDYVYLVVEGVYQSDPDCIKVRQGKGYAKTSLGSKHVDPYLNTLEVVTGVIVRHTLWPKQTANLIHHLYDWWQKGYDKHRSHVGFNVPRTKTTVEKPSLVMRVAKELPKIGWDRAVVVDKHFRSVEELVNATAEEWAALPGFGPKMAEAIRDAIEGWE